MSVSVSFMVITMNRFDDLEECVESIRAQKYNNFEIIVVDNNSEYEKFDKFREKYDCCQEVKVIRSEKNRGVSGGRNYGMQYVKGDILITIDDDAVIEDKKLTEKVVDRFNKGGERLGILAFKIVNFYSREVDKGYFPSKNKKKSYNEEFETTWFIGAGHAIKRKIYEKINGYRNYFPYGHEELDFSLRALDAGYRIRYFPEAEVYHKQAPNSGISSKSSRFYANYLSKRIQVAIQNLPWIYVITTSVVRTLQYLYISKFDLYAIFWGYYKMYNKWDEIIQDRKVISKKTIRKVIKLNGPVLY